MCGCGCHRCQTAMAYGFAVPHGGAVTRDALATHPASFNGGVRPTGTDGTTPVAGRGGVFARGIMVENPGTNQAGVTVPRSSSYGSGLRALVGGGRVVRATAPVLPPTRGGFRGFVGLVKSAAARSVIIPKGASYTGQLPLSQQPKVDKPRPWLDSLGIGAKYSG